MEPANKIWFQEKNLCPYAKLRNQNGSIGILWEDLPKLFDFQKKSKPQWHRLAFCIAEQFSRNHDEPPSNKMVGKLKKPQIGISKIALSHDPEWIWVKYLRGKLLIWKEDGYESMEKEIHWLYF